MLKLLSMKRKFTFIAVIITLILTLLPACDARETGSLKALTKPYIAHYECYEGSFGGEDLMEKFDYVEIILQDKENLLLSSSRTAKNKRSKANTSSTTKRTR